MKEAIKIACFWLFGGVLMHIGYKTASVIWPYKVEVVNWVCVYEAGEQTKCEHGPSPKLDTAQAQESAS